SRATTDCNVVDLVGRFGILSARSEKVCLNDVGDVTEIATRLAIPVNLNRLIPQHCVSPFRNHCRIWTSWVLSRTKNVEISETNAFYPVTGCKNVGIKFIDAFRNG